MIGKPVKNKIFVLTSLLLCFLLVAGCGGRLTRANYDRIQNGMTLQEVEAFMGKGNEEASSQIDIPTQSFSVPGIGSATVGGVSTSSKVVSWRDGVKLITLTFSNGKVVSKLQAGL